MGVVSMIKHNAVEEALFEAYETSGAKTDASNAAITALKTNGLPTRRVEAWHYTDLRSMLKSVPTPAVRPDAAAMKAAADRYPAIVETARVAVVDGYADAELVGEQPSGVSVAISGESLVAQHTKENVVGLLANAFAKDCLDISIDAGSELDKPIGLAHIAREGSVLATNQQRVSIGAKATATVIERYVQLGSDHYQNSAVTELTIGDDADATYIIAQQTGEKATHLGQINITLGANAKLTLFILNAGGALVRQDVNIDVLGEGADFQLRGVNLVGDNQHIDVTMDLHHAVPHTTSEEIIRNVVTGNGKGVFQGKIRVAQVAQKTDAKMACNTLLLTDDGDFSTKPELEIFADDVACGHGATFTDLEPSYMFYLMSRGIPEKEARSLLIKGFVDEIVEDLDDEAIEEAIVGVIDEWLDAHV